MKRNLALLLILTLVLSLALPSAALAKKGGIPANGKSAGRAPDAVESASEDAPAEAPEDAVEDGSGKDKQKDKGYGKKGAEAGEPEGSDETSPTAGVKRTGVDNALSRLQRNLGRMQTQLEAGKRSGLPEGIQKAIAKFMSWLGIDPPSDEAENTDEGSDEMSGTVEPEPVCDADDEAAGLDTTEAPVSE